MNQENDLGKIHSPEAVLSWNSQFCQDNWIIEHVFRYKRNGYFIEAGAHDGIRLSNTYILEKVYGWQGLCVEPGRSFELLKKNRSCICENVLLGPTDASEVMFVENGLLGGIVPPDGLSDQPNEAECRLTTTLQTLLDRHASPRIIDYLSLDVEGYEYEVLKDFPFSRYKILAMTVEHNCNKNAAQKMQTLLEGHGYRLFSSVGPDDWWLHCDCTPVGESMGIDYARRYFDLYARYKGLLREDLAYYKLAKRGVPVEKCFEVFWLLFKDVLGRYRQTLIFRRMYYYQARMHKVLKSFILRRRRGHLE